MPDDKKILFTAHATYRQVAGDIVYEAGKVHSLREDIANRWISRGVATGDPAAIAVVEAANAPPVPAARPTPLQVRPPNRRPAEADET